MASNNAVCLLFFLCFGLSVLASEQGRQASLASANPIRKVVTMLQMMQTKVIAEGEKETELYEKYVCWCKTGASSLGKSIADANTKIGELGPAIKEAESTREQLEADIKQHRADRDA